jgi:hypothetical protein
VLDLDGFSLAPSSNDGGDIVLHARNSASQVLPVASYADVTNYSAALIDPYAGFNATTGVYTVNATGNYYITGLVGIAVSSSTQRLLSFRLLAAGAAIAQTNVEVNIPMTFYGMTLSSAATLTAGQEIKMQAYSGIAEALINSDLCNQLTIVRM